MVGYLTADFFHTLIGPHTNYKISIDYSNFLYLIHHFMGGIGIYFMIHYRVFSNLGLYFALTEFTTPLLNLSWYLNAKESGRRIYCFLIFGFFFFIVRIFTIPFVILSLISCKFWEYQFPIVFMILTGCSSLFSLNLYWGYKIIKIIRSHISK